MSADTCRKIIAVIVVTTAWVMCAGGLYLTAMAGQP